MKNEKNITIELEGTVGGLLLDNGKIALHQAGKFFKLCSNPPKSQVVQSQTFLTVKNSLSGGIIAKYTTVIDGN